MFQILIVDDDKNLKRGLSLLLTDSGYRTFFADNVKEALHTLEKCRIDLMLLEAALPGTDGLTLTRLLRDCKNDLPILMLSSRKQPADIKKGFLAGVDDYVTKPFTPLELLARVNSHLRRYSKYLTAVSGEEQEKSHVYTIGGLELNEETVEVTVDGEAVKLTPMEFKIVQLLIKNPGRVFSADEIYERIWNEKAVNTDTIMVHVRNIREKIEIDPRNPKYLKVVWGVGYKIDKQ